MATVYREFDAREFIPAATNGPQHKIVDGTNFPVSSLAYDASTDETAYLRWTAINYGSGSLTCTIRWYADTASSANVVWGAALAVITADTDSQDVETKAFVTANTVQDTHLGTTGQRVHTCAITISNLDSLAANDEVWLKIYRDADSTAATDDMAGDALLLSVTLSYSDT